MHYDANIYYLSLIIRSLKKGCSLSIDSEFYLDRIIEDILFADDLLLKLSELLERSELQVSREQYLRDLYLCKRDFVMFLDDLCNDLLTFSSSVIQYRSRFTRIIQNQKEDMVRLDRMLSAYSSEAPDPSLVSQEEYMILFDPQDEDEE